MCLGGGTRKNIYMAIRFILCLALVLLNPDILKTLRNILMVFGSNVEKDETMCLIQEWQLSYFWHYLPLLYVTVIMHWFHVCSISRIPFGIVFFMILGRNVEQDKTTWHVQEWQLWLSYFLSYLPFLCLNLILILCLLCNMNILQNILMILGRNVEQDKMTCCVQEWQLWLSNF